MDRSIGILLAALRRRTRSTGARFFVGAFLLGLACAIWLPSQGAAGASVALESALVVIGIGAGLSAASSAGALPDDRSSGVHAWLAATACPKAVLRAAPVVAGVIATIVVTLGATLVAALMMTSSGLEVATWKTTPLTIMSSGYVSGTSRTSPGALVRREFLATRIEGPAGPAGSTAPVEIEFRPRFSSPESADLGSVHVSINEEPDGTRRLEVDGAPRVAIRGASILELPTGRPSDLSSFDSRVDLRVLSARQIDGPASFLANVIRAGLLIGLALSSIAPVAGLFSRFLSASTALSAALLLAGIGVLHAPLLSLAADAQGVEGGAFASAILRGAAWLAPDLSVVARASDALEGHVLTSDVFAGLLSPALHAAVAFLLLAFVPARRVDA